MPSSTRPKVRTPLRSCVAEPGANLTSHSMAVNWRTLADGLMPSKPLMTVNWLLPVPGKFAVIRSAPEAGSPAASVEASQARAWKAAPNQLLHTLPIWPPE